MRSPARVVCVIHTHTGRIPSPERSPDMTLLLSAAVTGDVAAARELLPLVDNQFVAPLSNGWPPSAATTRFRPSLSSTKPTSSSSVGASFPRGRPRPRRRRAGHSTRRILNDHARSRAAHGGGAIRLDEIGDVGARAAAESDQVLAVDAAVSRVETDDQEAAAVVRRRFVADMSEDQAAEALGISPRTAAPLRGYARAVLYRVFTEDRPGGSGMSSDRHREARRVFMEVANPKAEAQAAALAEAVCRR